LFACKARRGGSLLAGGEEKDGCRRKYRTKIKENLEK